MPILDHRTVATNPWAAPPTEPVPMAADYEELVPAAAQEVTPAERARTMAASSRSCAVAMVSADGPPVGVPVPGAVDAVGRPLLAIRRPVLERFDIRADRLVSVTFGGTPLVAGRMEGASGLTIGGVLEIVPRDEAPQALIDFGRSQPVELGAVRRNQARLLRVHPTSILMIEGDELLEIDLATYAAATDDPLATVAPGLVTHLSGEQEGSLLLLVRAFGGLGAVSSVRLVGIDQYGMDLAAETPGGERVVRLPFSAGVTSAEDVRREVDAMARGARFKLGIG